MVLFFIGFDSCWFEKRRPEKHGMEDWVYNDMRLGKDAAS